MEGEGVAVDIVLNDAFDCADLERYDKVVLSPGPGLPLDAGVLMDVVAACVGVRPVLGVCLGMQAIALHLGGSLYNQDVVKHGVAEFIELDSSSLFLGMSSPTQVGLYHSWAVESTGDFNVTARSKVESLWHLKIRPRNYLAYNSIPSRFSPTTAGQWFEIS